MQGADAIGESLPAGDLFFRTLPQRAFLELPMSLARRCAKVSRKTTTGGNHGFAHRIETRSGIRAIPALAAGSGLNARGTTCT